MDTIFTNSDAKYPIKQNISDINYELHFRMQNTRYEFWDLVVSPLLLGAQRVSVKIVKNKSIIIYNFLTIIRNWLSLNILKYKIY